MQPEFQYNFHWFLSRIRFSRLFLLLLRSPAMVEADVYSWSATKEGLRLAVEQVLSVMWMPELLHTSLVIQMDVCYNFSDTHRTIGLKDWYLLSRQLAAYRIAPLQSLQNGGTAPYSYSWKWREQHNLHQHSVRIPAGAYYVVITDANGCTGSASTTVAEEGSAPAAPRSRFPGPVGVCRNKPASCIV